MRLSVPGNLLLFGEYAVMEEGGLGLALAVEKRLHLELRPLPPRGEGSAMAAGDDRSGGADGSGGAESSTGVDGLIVEGRWSGGGLRWTAAHPESSPLIGAVVETCRDALRAPCALRAVRAPREARTPRAPAGAGAAAALPGGAAISIDSGAFFQEGGRKSGYGSSAAVAVGLSWALLAWAGLTEPELTAAVLDAALRGHRLAQGGLGSGYDVFASCLGGIGLFTGGQRPSWKPLELPWLGPLFLFRGADSVATPGAARRYRAWKASAPGEARRFLRRSNRCLRRFLASRSWAQASGWFDALADLGVWLGEAIGVPASIQPPPELACGASKALGAGNELGVWLAPSGHEPLPGEAAAPGARQGFPRGCEAVEVSRRGVLWQS